MIDKTSLYWDDFQRRIKETVISIKDKTRPVVRRVAVFVTDRCNFHCKYCNHSGNKTMSRKTFENILEKYGNTAIIHITGGEPSIVKWLYPFLIENGDKFRFHLNSNAYIEPPFKSIKRLKVSLDSCNRNYWNILVRKKNGFDRVVENIKKSIPHTVVSVTYTLTKQNYRQTIEFADFVKNEFKGLYAVFFSVYKGDNDFFILDKDDANIFFHRILPELKQKLSEESVALINETIDEKRRLIQGVRFPQNGSENKVCYLSMTERVFSPDGNEFTCSHLYRDGIYLKEPIKNEKCLYGCNRRLVQFNEEFEVLKEKVFRI